MPTTLDPIILGIGGAPWESLNTFLNPYALKPGAASANQDVDIQADTIRGLYGPAASAVADSGNTPGSTTRSIWYNDGLAAWQASTSQEWVVNDAKNGASVGAGAGKRAQYWTTNSGAAAKRPLFRIGNEATASRLGMVAPQGSSISMPGTAGRLFDLDNGGTAATRASGNGNAVNNSYWVYTWVRSINGVKYESNPCQYLRYNAADGTVTGAGGATPTFAGDTLNISASINSGGTSTNLVMNAPTYNPGSESGTFTTRFYRTVNGITGPYYFIAEDTTTVYPTAAQITDVVDATVIAQGTLNWGPAGISSSLLTQYDHSPWYTVTMFADSLYGGQGSTGNVGTGILFGADDDTLMWSMLNFPWYCPRANRMKMPEKIMSIVVDTAAVYVFLQTKIYLVTGSGSGIGDGSLTITEMPGGVGIRPGSEKTTARTPHGITFLSHQGLCMVYNNTTVRGLTEGVLAPTDFKTGETYECYWWDNQLFVFDTSASATGKSYVFTFIDVQSSLGYQGFPHIEITTTAQSVWSACVTNLPAVPGLSILKQSDHKIYSWLPRDRSSQGPTSWSFTTGKNVGPDPVRPKNYVNLWLNYTGPLAVTMTSVTEGGATRTYTPATLRVGINRLPIAMDGTYFTLAFSSSDGTGELMTAMLEGVLLDGI